MKIRKGNFEVTLKDGKQQILELSEFDEYRSFEKVLNLAKMKKVQLYDLNRRKKT